MPDNEHVPASLEEVISEIATILARGYMRHRNGRRLAPESDTEAVHVAQVEESEAFTEKRLDVSGHRSLHSFPIYPPNFAVRTTPPPGRPPEPKEF